MKKFKLIQEYPNSQPLNTIFEEYSSSNDYFRTVSGCYDGKWTLDYFESNPKFYEQVFEKDYEILSWKTPNMIVTSVIGLDEKQCQIYSIKRLSDGEIFTIGDKISNNGVACDLEKIVIDGNYVWFYYHYPINSEISKKYSQQYTNSLKNVKKAKSPLFKTEDGVDIYNSTQVYFIRKTWIISSFNADYDCIGVSKNLGFDKYFSTKEAAEEYIILNKPCLSINDITNIISWLGTAPQNRLKELVKSKL